MKFITHTEAQKNEERKSNNKLLSNFYNQDKIKYTFEDLELVRKKAQLGQSYDDFEKQFKKEQ